MPVNFRKEVSVHLQTQWKGKVLLLNGWPTWLVVLLTVSLVIALIVFLISGTYTRRITVNGEIITEPHTVNLFAPEQGVVSDLRVKNGQRVKAGDPLYQLDVSRISHTGNLTTTTLNSIQKQQQQLNTIIRQLKQAKQETLANVQRQLAQYEQAQQGLLDTVDSARTGMKSMRHSRDAYESALRKGLINTDQMSNQRYQFFQQQSMYQSLSAQAVQQAIQISVLRSEQITRATEYDNQILQSQYQLDDLARQRAGTEAQGSRMIVAPSDGVVSALSVTPGQMVNPGDSLIQLVPSSNPQFYLVVWLPDNSHPHVKTGETINIRYAAFPYEKYGQFPGRIISVSSAPMTPRELESFSSAPRSASGMISGAWYKAIVALEPPRSGKKALTLTSGMLAESTLFLEKRPLYQWMFSPYYSLKKSITGPVNE